MDICILSILAGQQLDSERSKQCAAHKAGQFRIYTHSDTSFLLFSFVAGNHDHDHADYRAPGPKTMLFHRNHPLYLRIALSVQTL
ncbi:hypothetical protein BACCAP_01264 [Pseudoflavonifractor capillosus ATCC 29799]|uniref:Uncharacterized protein n=1 Tax=Pseudoflavonifractor capillosus ATCC 29799 TaxID=411467 RepID=A6NST4_9FIRM|nr:hypothetical protein BACCAP_01264 [Pseudoflavonifractor capillosus ATCC 29799]